MTIVLLLVVLAAFVAIGIGVSFLRANERPPLIGSLDAKVRVWFKTLHHQRATGAALVAAGTLAVILVLVLRP